MRSVLFPLFLFAASCGSAAAQEDGAPLRAQLDRARAAADYGRAARDPLALIVAARMRRDIGLTRRATTVLEPPELDTPASLIAEARRLARGRRDVLRLADETLATGEKGRERGPLYEIGRIANAGSETFDAMTFAGGKRAEVYVEGARRLALVVRDAAGQTICADDAAGPVAYCWWKQDAAGAVRIEILNRAPADNAFRMVTN
jgi:hypothetical protein